MTFYFIVHEQNDKNDVDVSSYDLYPDLRNIGQFKDRIETGTFWVCRATVVEGCACIVVRLVTHQPWDLSVHTHRLYVARITYEFQRLGSRSLRMLVPCLEPIQTGSSPTQTTIQTLWDTPQTDPGQRQRFLFDTHPLFPDSWPYASDESLQNAMKWNGMPIVG